jgi:hypothetical protein
MIDIYYKIWVDAIVRIRMKSENDFTWKILSMIYITFAMAMNLAFVSFILQEYIFKKWFYNITIQIFPETKSRINGFLEFFILYVAIPLIMNYLLIFRHNRYEMLLEKFKNHNGRLFAWYFVSSLLLPFIIVAFAYLFIYSNK